MRWTWTWGSQTKFLESIERATGVRPPELDPPVHGEDWDFGPYLRAFDILNRSRKIERVEGQLAGQPVVQVSTSTLSLVDILAYARIFTDDVDDIRRFVRRIQILDQEFLNHGIRTSKTPRNS